MSDIHLAIVVGLTFLLAGLVKGVTGLGLPTVAIGLLSLVMPPVQAAALLVVPSLATNIWQFAAGPRHGALVRRLWPMLAAICAGSWAGIGVIAGASGSVAKIALGAALIVYAAAGFATLRLAVPPPLERWLAPVIGLATGLVTSATGVFVIPAVPYLQALQFDRDELVQALGLSFTVSTVALAAALAGSDAFRLTDAGTSLVALAPALAGMTLGQWARARVRPKTFRLCFFAGLLLLGGHLALSGVV